MHDKRFYYYVHGGKIMNDAHLLFENISNLWPIVLSLVFVLVWLVRIESKVLYLEKAHEDYS